MGSRKRLRRKSEKPHRTVHVKHGEWEADIDKMIAPLVLEMWRAGIRTCMSCEGNPSGYIWIVFGEMEALVEFLNIVRERPHGGGVPVDSMRYHYGVSDPYGRDQWIFRPQVEDYSSIDWETGEAVDVPSFADFVMDMNLHFPRKHLPLVLARLREHNRTAQ